MEREFLLKALVGSHNYGLATKESDRDYKVFVAPTFEDLYLGKTYSKQIVTDTEDHDIHDIRKLVSLFYKANVNFLEVLASSSVITACEEVEDIFALKKDIFRMNLPYLYNSCRGMHLNKMKLLDKGTEGTLHLVEKYGFDTKQALHAYRCLKVIVDFEATGFEDFDGAIRYSGDDLEFMMEIRHGKFRREAYEKFIDHYFHSTFVHLEEKYRSQPVNEELRMHLESIIMDLVKRKIVSVA